VRHNGQHQGTGQHAEHGADKALHPAGEHRPEGGLGSAVSDALLAAGRSNLSLAHLAVRELPGSGSGAELLAWAGLDADHIAAAARKLIDPAWANLGLSQ
jgi:transketolase C-terminal domain/subunit